MRSTAKLSRLCLALVIALTYLLSCAGATQAQARSEVGPASTGARIYLGRSHGYVLVLSMPNPKIAVLNVYRFSDALNLEGGGQPEAFLQTGYAVRVKGDLLSRGYVRAVFPSIGRVSLHFKGSGKRHIFSPGNRCQRAQVSEFGTFRGNISLRGEGGYFEIATRSAGGSLTEVPRPVCGDESDKEDEDLDPLWEEVAPSFGFNYSPGSGSIALLYAVERTASRTIGIRVAHSEGAPAGAEVDVHVLELRHGMAIGRLLYEDSNVPGTFATSLPGEHPASAILKPPAPFRGEGLFLENSPTSHSWAGDLSVSLLGSDVSLTGPRFKTSLCVVSPLKVPDGCDFRKPKLVGNARPGIPVPGGIGE